jgi:hypothetical protein
MMYGGHFGSESRTDLTAVPVTGPRRRLTADRLAGVLRARGEPVRVAAVERPRAFIIIVQDLRTLGAWPAYLPSTRSGFQAQSPELRPVAVHGRRGDVAVHMSTVPFTVEGVQVYPVGLRFDLARINFGRLVNFLPESFRSEPREQRLEEAVAMAGLRAAISRQPRAVVLATGPERARPGGDISPSGAAEYLARLRVPLHVWTVGMEEDAAGWGDHSTPIDRIEGPSGASRAMLHDAQKQSIAWIEGSWLPDEIEVIPGETGVRLAGSN